ncbi:MAG: alpha-1,2-fucosyltransferase [Chitinophagaceae bacterium]|nr:alpha-1,2-fucosyltransferase [Chitinophagaceae bacterium]
MVIVHISAGLGNQMFQYALYHTFIDKGLPAKIELSAYSTKGERRKYELEKVFGVKPLVASVIELEYLKVISKVKFKLFDQPYKETHQDFGTWNDKVRIIQSGYLNGYWQSEKYFIDIQDKIRKLFTFPALTDSNNQGMLKLIQENNAVSIHIRRSDYLENENWAMGLGYYQKAIALMKTKFANALFIVFSDDINWAKKNFTGADYKFVDFNTDMDSYKDMQLMSQCNHHIIANSSFSWWGAWLNPGRDKVVVAPDRWIPSIKGTRDIIPGNWIKLPAG